LRSSIDLGTFTVKLLTSFALKIEKNRKHKLTENKKRRISAPTNAKLSKRNIPNKMSLKKI
jgi:hypothetical protein